MGKSVKVDWERFEKNVQSGSEWGELYDWARSFEIDENEVIISEGIFKGHPIWVAHVFKVAQMNKESNTSRCNDWLTRCANLIKEDLEIFPKIPYQAGNVFIGINDFTGEIKHADSRRLYEFEQDISKVKEPSEHPPEAFMPDVGVSPAVSEYVNVTIGTQSMEVPVYSPIYGIDTATTA